MSTARLGRAWADVDEEDEDDISPSASKMGARCFETPVDEHGIKTVIEYKERDGKTYKVSRRIRQTTMTKWSNQDMEARKTMEKFGKAKTNDEATEASHVQQSVEEINIEVCKKAIKMAETNDAEDKFLEEALKNCENLFKEKKVWTDLNRDKQINRDDATTAPATDAKPAEAAATTAPAPTDSKTPGKYVPPSIRAAEGKGKGKGDLAAQQEASLRITNLSEDAREGDLQDLFSQFGRLQRVFLSKDPITQLPKGFAFVTYYHKEEAQKAIDKLNGHGYDNLILQVQWAKPRA
jgi:translation initiation factor 3 subunit G